MGIIISAFPACGKTFFFNNFKNKYKILDSDSSMFSWGYDSNGNKTDCRNPDFPNNYIQHIKDNYKKYDIIFISSHQEVREAMKENNIDYFLVYPDINEKENWLQRMKNRNSPDTMISFIDKNWDNFIQDIESEYFPILVKLGTNSQNGNFITEYLIDNLFFINSQIYHA